MSERPLAMTISLLKYCDWQQVGLQTAYLLSSLMSALGKVNGLKHGRRESGTQSIKRIIERM